MCRKVGIDKTKGSTSCLQSLQKVNNGKFFSANCFPAILSEGGQTRKHCARSKTLHGKQKMFPDFLGRIFVTW